MTRERVTAPARTGRARGPLPPSSSMPRRGGSEAYDADQFYLRSLLRSQLRLALVVAGGFLLIAGTFSALLTWVPWLQGLSLLDVPFAWLLIGVGLFPVMLLSAWLYTRLAQRNEDRYRELSEER